MHTKISRALCRSLAVAVAVVGIAVGHAPAESQTPRTVTGVVEDATTGSGLTGVHVSTGQRGVYTDGAGRFSIQVDSDSPTLRFRRIGFVTEELPVADFTGTVMLTSAPILLDAIVAEAHAGHQLAVGTALAVENASGDELRKRAPSSLAEAMLGVEGLTVSRTGAWGSRPVLRGIGGERLAVMVDGSRLNRACTFGMDQGLATIDPATVERVEVLTGPGSTLYGSGNIGGVINVVTRRATSGRPVAGEIRSGLSSGVPGGSLGGSLWLRGDRWDASMAVDGGRYGDYYAPAGRVSGSGFSQLTGDLKLGFAPTPTQQLQVQGQLYEARDIGWPGVPGGIGSIPEESRNSFAVDYGWQRGKGVLDALSGRAYRQRLDHHMTMTMQMAGGGMAMSSQTDARSFSTTTGGRVQARLVPMNAAHVDVGAEVTQWAAEATRWVEQTRMGNTTETALRTWPDVRILDVGAFAQGEAALYDALTFSAGARLDRVTRRAEGRDGTAESVGTGNLGFRADLGRGFGTRGTVGMGFRIPDPTELFGLAIRPDGYLYRGNANLATETSRNVELSVDYGDVDFNVSATAFHNELSDLIAPVTVPGETVGGRGVREYENIAEARLVGMSGSGNWTVSDAVDVTGTLTYTRGEDRRTGLPLPQIPPLEGTAAISLFPTVGPEYVTIEGRAAARQERVASAVAEQATPGFGVLNLRTGFSLAGADVVAGVENLLDHEYRGHLDSPVMQPGRNLYLRVVRAF